MADPATRPGVLEVCIATYRRWHELPATLASVFAQQPGDFLVRVIDQTPDRPDGQPAGIAAASPPGRLAYVHATPPSLPAARNLGWTASPAEIIVFLDDDVRLEPGHLAAVRRAFAADPRLGVLAGRVLDTPCEVPAAHLPRWRRDGTLAGTFDALERAPCEAALGCNMAFRRAALAEVRGFDTAFAGNAVREESDCILRVRRAGWRVAFEPDATVRHLASASGGCRVDDLLANPLYQRNCWYFLLRHFGPRAWLAFASAVWRSSVWPHKRGWLPTRRFLGRTARLAGTCAHGAFLHIRPRPVVARPA